MEFPCGCQRLIQLEKIPQTGVESPPDGLLRHGMSAALHAAANPIDRKLRRWKRNEEEMKVVAGRCQFADPGREAAAGEGSLKGHIQPLIRKMVGAPEHQTACLNGGALGVEFGEAARDRIGIDELMYTQGALQQVGGSGCFAGSVRSGQHDEMRALRKHGELKSRTLGVPLAA